MKKRNYFFLFLFFTFSYVTPGGFVKGLMTQDYKSIITTANEEKKEELEALKQIQTEQEKEREAALANISKQIVQVKADILNTDKMLKIEPSDQLLKAKATFFSQKYSTLKKVQELWHNLLVPIEENIAVHEEYLSDPDLEVYFSETIGDKTIYSFEDLQKIFQLVEDQKRKVENLKREKENEKKELENRKKTVKEDLAKFEILKEKRQQDQLDDYQGLSAGEQEQAWDFEEQLFSIKENFNDRRLQEIELKIDLTDIRLFFERQKLDLIKESLKRIKPKVRISEATITAAKDHLAKSKQEAFKNTANLHQKIDFIKDKISKKEVQQKEAEEQYSIPVTAELDIWKTKPVKSADGYLGLCKIGNLHDQILLLKRNQDNLQAKLELEEKEFGTNGLKEVFLDVKETFFKIITRKFANEQEINQEKRKYEVYRSRIDADISDITNRNNKAQDYLAAQKKAQDNLDILISEIKDQRSTIFVDDINAYNNCLGSLRNSKNFISAQVKALNDTISTYNDILATLQKILKQIDFISTELDSIGIWWQRPDYAITWTSIKKTVPDVTAFFRDLQIYILNFSVQNFAERVIDVLRFPLTAFTFVVKLLILFLVLFLLWFYLPSIVHILLKPVEKYSLLQSVRLFSGFVCQFIYYYYGFLASWIFLYALLNVLNLADPYPFILFYLISVPYFLFLANRFIAYLAQANKKNNYVFIGKEFEGRFVFVFSLLTYSTICIFFFRRAFLLSGYTQSEVPTILLALNLIILQIALISFLVKEPILSIIPEDTPFWQWIKSQVSKYYYLILAIIIAIIIMSNPYVGFGRLVLYILTRVFYSILLVVGFIWLHNWLKKAFLHMFFVSDIDLVKERFNYAKTWYGITVILLFVVSFIVGIFFIAKIWGWPPALTEITDWSDIIIWLKTPFIGQETKGAISLYLVLQGIFFIVVGILLASAFDRFVLGKISDILVVDPGVQDTISRFSRYLIIAIAIIVGLATANLSTLLPWIGASLLALGFVIKEPLADFFAHFIILVQRPIKIGDYIEIDENVAGVVRKITARSVIIRKKNSTTIIIPNSEIINKSVFNWNYTRGFVALNDISVSVSYESDPDLVVKLLLEVFQENQNVLKNPKPIIRLNDFSLDGFQFMMRGFVSSNYTLDIWDIASDIRIGVSKKLKENNIKLAIPVRLLMRTKSSHEHMGTDQGAMKE